jgi:hypothetical protein
MRSANCAARRVTAGTDSGRLSCANSPGSGADRRRPRPAYERAGLPSHRFRQTPPAQAAAAAQSGGNTPHPSEKSENNLRPISQPDQRLRLPSLRFLPRNAREGDHAKRGGGGGSVRRRPRLRRYSPRKRGKSHCARKRQAKRRGAEGQSQCLEIGRPYRRVARILQGAPGVSPPAQDRAGAPVGAAAAAKAHALQHRAAGALLRARPAGWPLRTSPRCGCFHRSASGRRPD